MNKEDWEKALQAWEAVHKQALLDLDQSDLYIESIKEKIQTLK